MNLRLAGVLQELDRFSAMSNEKLEQSQLNALRETVFFHYSNNPTYRAMCDEANVNPNHLNSLSDISKLPIVERDYLKVHGFFKGEGGALSVDFQDLVTYLNSSGSTGKSKRIPIARMAQDSIFNISAQGIWINGVRGYDKDGGGVIMPIFPHGPWPSAYFVQNGCEMIGFSSKSDMSMPFEWHINNMLELKPKYIVTSPSFISALLQNMKKTGFDPGMIGLERIVLGGEFFSEDFRDAIEEQYHTRVLDIYGCAETQVTAVECDSLHKSGWLHYLPNAFIMEIVKPGTSELVPRGENGEMIITVLNRRAWPVIRYRMGDIISFDENADRSCGCGYNFPRISRIKGRADDMLVYGNANIYPQMVWRSVQGIPLLSQDKFQFSIVGNPEDHTKYHAEFKIELTGGISLESMDVKTQDELKQRVLDNLLAQSDELTHAVTKGKQVPAPVITLVDAEKLYKQQGKLRRMLDLRHSR